MLLQMSCPEMDAMRRQVCDRLRGTVNSWEWNLQNRYGDPRMYALQQQQMHAQQAALEHDLSRRSSRQFEQTYDQVNDRAKQTHAKRIAGRIKSERTTRARGRQNSTTRPESAAGPARKQQPPDAPAPAPA